MQARHSLPMTPPFPFVEYRAKPVPSLLAPLDVPSVLLLTKVKS